MSNETTAQTHDVQGNTVEGLIDAYGAVALHMKMELEGKVERERVAAEMRKRFAASGIVEEDGTGILKTLGVDERLNIPQVREALFPKPETSTATE